MLTEFKTKISGLELEPSDGGCFELTVGNSKVYSKLEVGQFPEEDAVTKEVSKLL